MKNHEPLDDLLTAWQVEARPPADFQRQVWHRIAADQEALPWSTRLFSWWLQPRRLLLSAAAAITLGGLLGVVEARIHNSNARGEYFSAINPLDSQHQHVIAAK